MIIYEDVTETDDSVAHQLAALVFQTEMPPTRRLEFMALIAWVRRQEVSLNELYDEAREDAVTVEFAENVVRVDFGRGR